MNSFKAEKSEQFVPSLSSEKYTNKNNLDRATASETTGVSPWLPKKLPPEQPGQHLRDHVRVRAEEILQIRNELDLAKRKKVKKNQTRHEQSTAKAAEKDIETTQETPDASDEVEEGKQYTHSTRSEPMSNRKRRLSDAPANASQPKRNQA